MISSEDLRNNYYPVEEFSEGFFRCADEMPRNTYYTYFSLLKKEIEFFFILSDNIVDDSFAELCLKLSHFTYDFKKIELDKNSYGFSHMLLVPSRYHSELKGRFDDDRDSATLCIPIFNSEFSGKETVEEFINIRRNIVPTLNWRRDVSPRTLLRFDNEKTRSGTGDGYVFVKFEYLILELKNIVGVQNAFLEIINYCEKVIEVTYFSENKFNLIFDRVDTQSFVVSFEDLKSRIWLFLTQ